MRTFKKSVTMTGFAAIALTGLAVSAAPTAAAEPMGLVGPGCPAYAEQVPTGPGSVNGMAREPVTVAAANNPLLTTLTAAISGQLNPEVNLVDTLNGGEFTVFAPTDAPMLTNILTYHVVPGRVAPEHVAGMHTTVQGQSVTVTGAGNELMVNDAAVVCGGVPTANATVYLVDTVLMPPPAA